MENSRGLLEKFPCGKCMPCRVTRRQEWTARLLLEMKTSYAIYFVTLTYQNPRLPSMGSLKKKHLQNFLKRLRKRVTFKFRYFACGEYGDKGRPHYHLLLFADGEFNTKYGYCHIRRKSDVSISGDIHKAWSTRMRIHNISDGFNECWHAWSYGLVDVVPILKTKDQHAIAAYVCKYVLKSITEKKKCLPGLEDQFFLMSRGNMKDGKVGIGYAYAEKIASSMKARNIKPLYSSGAYPIDAKLQMIKIDGKLYPISRYLRELIKEKFPPDERNESDKFWSRYYTNVVSQLRENDAEISKASAAAQKAFKKYMTNRGL